MKLTTFTPEQAVTHELSERIVHAQGPILILDALKWDTEIKETFFKSKFKKLPAIDEQYYARRSLRYDPDKKIAEFYDIEHDIRKNLGQFSAVSQMMLRMCREYREVLEMIKFRGQKPFGKISQNLYGSSEDAFYAGGPTLKDLADSISETLDNMKGKIVTRDDRRDFTAEQAVAWLTKRLDRYFPPTNENQTPKVVLSDDILADAAAGAEILKINRGAMFSRRALRQLEVHEGWVHLGTTFNGKLQPICTFLSKGTPSSTTTQEGLAIIMEIITFSSFPSRVRKIINRVKAINMAENGADFIEVFRFFMDSGGYDEEESYAATVRVFRGSTSTGKPFTKDLSYNRGFVQIFNYIRLAVDHGLVKHIPMLFVGKTSLEDLRLIVDLVDEGLVVKPKFVPHQFKDPAPLCAWAAYSLFINKLDPNQLASDFRNLLRD